MVYTDCETSDLADTNLKEYRILCQLDRVSACCCYWSWW